MLKPLPEEMIVSLFARLQVRYGSSWLNKWAGIDLADVRADWAQVLAGYSQSPDAIFHGLDCLPTDSPPNAMQFALLCRGAPRSQSALIEGPAPTPARRKEVTAMLARARRSVTGHVA